MNGVAIVLTAFVALEHLGILVLEMFLWDQPIGLKVFAMTPEVAAASKVLAMNQGLYNGFLAAGLIWGLGSRRRDVSGFFLGCIVIAGLFGGLTAKTSIMFTQGLPALIALLCTVLAPRDPRRR